MSKEFTAQQIEEARRVFNQFDKDGSGAIDIKELGSVFKELGQNPSESQLKEMIKSLDKNNDSLVQFDEFLQLLRKPGSNAEKQIQMVQSFKTFDRNGDGFITKEEFLTAMQNLGESISEEEVNRMIRDGDIDGDGRINYHEFVKMMS